MKINSSYFKIDGALLILMVAVLANQNCAPTRYSSPAAAFDSLSKSGPWNGQSYQSYGFCASATGINPGIMTEVYFSNDGSQLTIDKQNCTVLAQPITIPTPTVTAFNSGTLLLIGTQIFDQVTAVPAVQISTSTLCTDSNGFLTASVWTTSTGETVGQVILASGSSTGALPINLTANGYSGPSSFSLVLTNPPSVTFELQGLTSTDANLTCYSYSNPVGQPLSPVTLLLPGELVYQIPSGVNPLQLALVGAGGGGVAGGAGGGSGGFTDTGVSVSGVATVCLVVGAGGDGASSGGSAANGQASAVYSGNCSVNTQQNLLISSSGGQGANGDMPGNGGTGTVSGNSGFNPATQSGAGASADTSFPFGAGGSTSGSAGQSGFLSILF